MATVNMHGFTVIELMLFLGVTGALFAALMIGVQGNITQQRYRESVVDLSTYLQSQYSEVANTHNVRDNNLHCESSSDGTAVIVQQPDNEILKGRGVPCVILGRAITIAEDTKEIVVAQVIGIEPSDQAAVGDIESLIAYKPQIADYPDSKESEPVGWGSRITSSESKPASVLILRSPSSGLIKVYSSFGRLPGDNKLAPLITASAADSQLSFCVRSDSGVSPLRQVTVNSRIAGPDGIATSEDQGACA
jgi:type II secretory pathway pseudopilin PulG